VRFVNLDDKGTAAYALTGQLFEGRMAIDWNDWKPPWRAPPISRFEPKKPPPLSENIVLEERADQIDEARLPLWRRIFLGLFLGGAIATLFSPVDPPKEPEISRPVPVVRLDARAAACLNVTFKAPFYVASRNAQPSPMCVRPRRFEWLAAYLAFHRQTQKVRRQKLPRRK
jgi:hypothetical protein